MIKSGEQASHLADLPRRRAGFPQSLAACLENHEKVLRGRTLRHCSVAACSTIAAISAVRVHVTTHEPPTLGTRLHTCVSVLGWRPPLCLFSRHEPLCAERGVVTTKFFSPLARPGNANASPHRNYAQQVYDQWTRVRDSHNRDSHGALVAAWIACAQSAGESRPSSSHDHADALRLCEAGCDAGAPEMVMLQRFEDELERLDIRVV